MSEDLPETQDADDWPAGRCWFCGGPATAPHAFRVGLHREHTTTHLALGLVTREEWQWLEIPVPRCGRCRTGHYADVLLLLAGIPTLAWGIGMVLDTALGNYMALPLVPSTVPRIGVWFLPFLAWLSVRYGWFGLRAWFPHNRRYARRHPVVQDRLEDGWRYGKAPLSQWDRRWS